MREHLFRGKTKGYRDNRWVEGFLLKKPGISTMKYLIAIPNSGTAYEVDPETVGEYTGFRDNGGNRIYEDDILKMITRVKDGKKRIFTVKWCDKCGMWVLPGVTDEKLETDFTCFWGYDFKIIGNIHDNPELLEGETDD